MRKCGNEVLVGNGDQWVKDSNGEPSYWVGGGSFKTTFIGVFILKEGNKLPKCRKHKNKGTLACSTRQSLVNITTGDTIVTITGYLPITKDNLKDGKINIIGKKVVDIEKTGYMKLRNKTVDFNSIPISVIEGLKKPHNRNGSFFTKYYV